MSVPMRISPCYTVDDWKMLDLSKEKDWQKAIGIFEDRIRGRFLEFVKLIEHKEYAGFVVLAIDCLLIETLQQFRKGKPETPRRMSECYFVEFLTETSFKEFFDKCTAGTFYKQIRCGILHQAEVKETSRVTKGKRNPLVGKTDDGQGLVINRDLFHSQLVEVFEGYLSDLRDPCNADLRCKFKKKMDYICRVPMGD